MIHPPQPSYTDSSGLTSVTAFANDTDGNVAVFFHPAINAIPKDILPRHLYHKKIKDNTLEPDFFIHQINKTYGRVDFGETSDELLKHARDAVIYTKNHLKERGNFENSVNGAYHTKILRDVAKSLIDEQFQQQNNPSKNESYPHWSLKLAAKTTAAIQEGSGCCEEHAMVAAAYLAQHTSCRIVWVKHLRNDDHNYLVLLSKDGSSIVVDPWVTNPVLCSVENNMYSPNQADLLFVMDVKTPGYDMTSVFSDVQERSQNLQHEFSEKHSEKKGQGPSTPTYNDATSCYNTKPGYQIPLDQLALAPVQSNQKPARNVELE